MSDTKPHDWLMVRPTPERSGARGSFIVWCGVLLGFGLAAIRLGLLAGPIREAGIGTALRLAAQGLWQDWAITLGLIFVGVALYRSAPGARMRGLINGLVGLVAVLVLIWGLANILALKMLGAPVTVEWLAYSDIRNTDVILDSLRRVLSLPVLVLGAAAVLGLIGGAVLLARRVSGGGIATLVLAMFAIGTVAGLAQGAARLGAPKARLENPVVAFLGSVGRDGGLSGVSALSQAPAATLEMPFAPASPLARPPEPAKPLRNVILYAFESTPARQAQGWGGTQPVTPNLQAALARGLAFDNAYAHVPASNFYLVSVFGGLIPELSTVLMTSSNPDLRLQTLADVLGEAGLRTGFFNSSDNRFQNAEAFLSKGGFDHVADYRDWDCAQGVYEFESVTDQFLNTSSDLCSIDAITDWIAEAPERPFFAAFRTGMTHYPYFPGEAPQTYVEDPEYNDYLNALRVGDEAFGKLLDWLEAEGLADETLIVVLGDHGEAFGEHGTRVHASAIYEENVHIPMALINPQLFAGARSDLIVGVNDIAPTVADLLGLAPAPSWQGRSFFAGDRRDGVLFFAPWNGFQIGFRDGVRKFIFNGNSGAAQLYDLAADPGERVNLAETDAAALAEARRVMGQAIAVQNAYIDQLLRGTELPQNPFAARRPGTEIVIEASGTTFLAPPRAWITLDGEHVGLIEVTSAPSNAERAATQAEIDAGLMTFRLPVKGAGLCPREIGIWFLNDAWAGDGKTGDTDLYIRSVRFAGETYYFNRFHALEPGVAGSAGSYYRFYRTGQARVSLALDKACVSAELARP